MKIKRNIVFVFVLLILMVSGFHMEMRPDDKELFMGINISENIVRPNVVILMDSSGSMNTIIFYPKKGVDGLDGTDDDGYDPNISYSGYVEGFSSDTTSLSQTGWYARWIVGTSALEFSTSELENYNGDGKNFWTGCYAGDGSPNNFQVGSNGTSWFFAGDTVLFRDTSSPYYSAVATVSSKYTDASGNTWFELSNIVGGPITVNGGHFQKAPDGRDWKPVVVQLYGTLDHSQYVRYPRDYMDWLFIHATDEHRAAVSHFSTWGTFDVTSEPEPVLSNCATPGNDDLLGTNPRVLQVFTRIQVAREVVCKVATESNQIVKLGLFQFTYDNGSTLEEGLTDMSDEASLLVAYKNNVWDIYASTWTPLAEALADVWYYYKPGPASKTYWPVDYEIEHNTVNHSISNPVTPMDYWCQNNYVVLMTDGESTQDRFDSYTKYGNSIFKQEPVKRSEPWESWEDGWGDTDNNEGTSGVPSPYDPSGTYCPNYTCWYTDNGSDYLDDVAYFMANQDMFPDEHFGTDQVDGWPSDQNIYTYTIGFAADNHMLLQTAINGEGAYYTANNYEELVEAFQLVITSIELRNYAFSSITAPKKTTTATDDELTVSYVGYFMPSQAASIWEGHLLAFKLEDLWGFDVDGSDTVTSEEFVYQDEEQCVIANNGEPCERWVYLDIGHQWDASQKIPIDRNLYANNPDPDHITELVPFTTTNRPTLQPWFGAGTTDLEAEQIITKITYPQLGDIFHSDVGFVAPPAEGKKLLPNINPPGENDETFEEFFNDHKDRQRVIYVGTNDGIMHMVYADGTNGGEEAWGFIPDEVLPTLKTIVIDGEHNYTVDGRLTAEDIYFKKDGSNNSWSTILCFGLRRGGNAYYALDITEVSSQPQVLWKFEDDTWSGQSWGNPALGRVLINDPDDPDNVIQKWVAFLTGGFAFNSENPNDRQGKALFMVDATNGELLWMLGYDQSVSYTGAVPPAGELRTKPSDDELRLLTKEEEFNFCIPSALTAVDKDNNGYVDTLYFGNVAGHLFKTDISSSDPLSWKTYILFKTVVADEAATTITEINDTVLTLEDKAETAGFAAGDSVMGKTSYATGYIQEIYLKTMTVVMTSGTFQVDEQIAARTYDPIYLAPTLTYDRCFKLWLMLGTGDRDRPRTNKTNGHFVLFKDNGTYLHQVDNEVTADDDSQNLQDLSDYWVDDTLTYTSLVDVNGWYFKFPDDGEKLFDPEPVVIPDKDFNPRLIFNSYQPPPESVKSLDNPCASPDEGTMTLYELLLGCGLNDTIGGDTQQGRIAGGGIYGGKEYILYEGTDGNVASAPGSDDQGKSNIGTSWSNLGYHGGIVFWKEKKR